MRPESAAAYAGIASRLRDSRPRPAPTALLPAKSPTVLREYYDACLRTHGDTAAGAAWPNDADRRKRFEVLAAPLLESPGPQVVVDLGCGTGELLRFLKEAGRRDITYIGVDTSEAALEIARAKFPEVRWVNADVLEAGDATVQSLACDWLIANGLFTVRRDLGEEQMWDFMAGMLERMWPQVRGGIAFNVMSSVVDWKRSDLFHVSHDKMAHFLHRLAGRRVRMRADYGLYEYACFAFRPEPAPDTVPARIAACRPRLPTASRLLPYLQRIDRARIYSNHGQLVGELEARLAEAFGVGGGHVLAAASGTAALTAGILAAAGRASADRPLALCPAFTFIASASALQQCGYEPYLVDVDPDTWRLDPDALLSHPQLGRAGVVMPVAAMGRDPDLGAWREFRRRSGVPVVVDAAASFEKLLGPTGAAGCEIPLALSFHATKAFACGEGGALVCTDPEVQHQAFRALNFGFYGQRESRTPSINGKMSEYHAAVGLAGLDGWASHHAAFVAVADAYRARFDAQGLAVIVTPDVAANYALFLADDPAQARRIAARLAESDIETRHWYGPGLHAQPVFATLERDPLPETDRLGACLVGLPMAPDLDAAVIERIAAMVRAAIDGTGPGGC